MYDIHNLELDPITAGWKAHKAAQDRTQGRESAATSEGKETPADMQKTPQSDPGTPIFTLHLAHCRENAKNVQYPSTLKINGIEDLKLAAQYDHMPGKMVNNYRHSDNFMECDCLVFDVDNTHTDEPDGWIRADDIAEALPVALYLIESRNYMKAKSHTDPKTGYTVTTEPREKWHGYCPLSHRITNKAEYERLIKNVVALFPFVDISAIDAARFFYGVQEPHITYYEPESPEAPYIDTYIAGMDPAALKEAQTAAIVDYTKHVKDGSYKNDKANQTTVKTVYEFLGYKNPLPDQSETMTPAPAAGDPAASMPEWMLYSKQAERETWFLKWAHDHNVELGKRYTGTRKEGTRIICYCVKCPWEEEHTPGEYPENEAVVIIEENGKLSFLCRHRHGKSLKWRDYRAYYEAQAAPDQAQEGQEPEPLPGLLTYEAAVDVFENADDGYIELKAFPEFSKAAQIQVNDSVVLAADTGMGKSALAINFMNGLIDDYPCMYFNLEMSNINVLRRLVAIQSGIEINRIKTYKHDPKIAEAVNTALKTITEKHPIQVIKGVYMLEDIDKIIERSTEGREEPTIVIIDHSLLVDLKSGSAGRYDRFTQVSEKLRKMAQAHNVVFFILLQQSRSGKAMEEERPKNSSLKESGSWENDATQIVFLWWDPIARKKKLIITKNRNGEGGEFALEYWKDTQTYIEAQDPTGKTAAGKDSYGPQKMTKREKQQEKLKNAYQDAYINTFGHPTLRAMAEAADVTTGTIKTWIKEYGGCTVDGIQQDPAGIDTEVEYTGFVKLTPADDPPQGFDLNNLELFEDDRKEGKGKKFKGRER